MKNIILFFVCIVVLSSKYACDDKNIGLVKRLRHGNESFNQTNGANSNEKIFTQLLSTGACSQYLLRCIFLSTILGLLILFSIIGNSFVIAAVFLDRNLHNLANYLIVSLAFADLTVAVMVMPIGAYQEVFREWSLGKVLCDIWTIFDVLCCTASILHLVAIALDRYWAITKFGYASSRTPRLILTFIGIIWSVSLVVAVSPHIFGLSYDVNNTERCHLTDHLTYQLVSTVAAFYLPLIGMCVIYWKIFRTAKLRIRKKAFKSGSLLPKSAKHKKKIKKLSKSTDSGENRCQCQNSKNDKVYNCTMSTRLPTITKTENVSVNSSIPLDSPNNNKPVYLCEDSSCCEAKTAFAIGEYDAMSSSLECMSIRHGSEKEIKTNGDRLIKKKDNVKTSKKCMNQSTRPDVQPDQLSNILKKRAYIDLKRERKAAKTLGVIMTCFIVCWLPYFLMQIFFSICKNCYLTKLLEDSYLVTLLTWSGYLNSMLNPVIYTIFSPDFRNAFAKLLVGKYRL